eukprot:scaffold145_cov261-Pinguiococcus_pyrenoidosus.AAC.17
MVPTRMRLSPMLSPAPSPAPRFTNQSWIASLSSVFFPAWNDFASQGSMRCVAPSGSPPSRTFLMVCIIAPAASLRAFAIRSAWEQTSHRLGHHPDLISAPATLCNEEMRPTSYR